MDLSFEELKHIISRKGLNLSHQRLKVYEYLYRNQCHPTADQVYTGLQKDMPTLSKTTVYNTLRILVKAGMVRMITIEESEIRYDIELETHGHFKCELCGSIYNFRIDVDLLNSEDLNNFKIKDKNVYFKGICPGCLVNINKK